MFELNADRYLADYNNNKFNNFNQEFMEPAVSTSQLDVWLKLSKFLTYCLKHAPEKGEMVLKSDGTIPLNDILATETCKSLKITKETVEKLIYEIDRARFILKEDENGETVVGLFDEKAKEELARLVGDAIRIVNPDLPFKAYYIYQADKILVDGILPEADALIRMDTFRSTQPSPATESKYVIFDIKQALADNIECFLTEANRVLVRNPRGGPLLGKYLTKPQVVPDEESKTEIAQPKPVEQLEFVVVLDFEAQCDEKTQLKVQEIIEMPSIILDLSSRQIIDTFHTYVKPEVHAQLFPFCTELTGITQVQVDAGIPLEKALLELDQFLVKHGLVDQDGKKKSRWAFATCGDWDLRQCLKGEAVYKKIDVKPYMREWVNIKDFFPFPSYFGAKKPGMATMLELLNMKLEGKHHSGIDDSKNLVRIVQALLRQGVQISTSLIKSVEYQKKKGKK